jgi:signal transduction histidine kinase
LEAERTRLATELHDDLIQKLTILSLELSLMDGSMLAEPNLDRARVRAKVDELAGLVSGMIRSLRKMKGQLRPKLLDEYGLIAALEWATDGFRNRTGLKCRFKSQQEELSLPPQVATELFRAFQEILSNIEAHAQAERVDVDVRQDRTWLQLRVSDNGAGIGYDKIASDSSLGLLELRERVLPLGGEVQVEGVPGKGTTVTIKVPVGACEEASGGNR